MLRALDLVGFGWALDRAATHATPAYTLRHDEPRLAARIEWFNAHLRFPKCSRSATDRCGGRRALV